LNKLKPKTFEQLRTQGFLVETSSVVVRGEVDHSLNENVLEYNNFSETLALFLDGLINETYQNLVREANDGVKVYTNKRDN